MKLLQISGKRVLQSFTHSTPSSVAPPALNERMDEGDEEEEEVILAVECVGLSNGSLKYAASGGMDKCLKIWDLVSGTCRSSCGHGDAVVNLRWHSTLPLITTAALDKMVRVLDARNGSLLLELSGHTNIITNLDLMSIPAELIIGDKNDPNNETDIIVSVSDDNTAKVFHINSLSLLS
jgi:ribosome assembly protein SQT1